ncbi:MAG: nucleotide exchange factor GrpE [Parvularculaceae bacterium]|nr:nucleotide exchange factor GrpE [Parvularculaceae bacterium]
MSDTDYEPNQDQLARDAAAAGDVAPEAIVAGLQDEIARLNDRLLRIAAELENTRRRAEREKVDAGKYAIASFARDLLSVSDTFGRALASAPAVADEATRIFVDGVRMTEKELANAFERHGVRRIEPKGEKFDPNLHMAVAQAPGSAPAGQVLDVAQAGYIIGDRVLRAAMVVVSTGAGAGDAHGPLTDEPPHHLDRRA